ncbi:MAG: hypothetical protein Q8L14_37005 [Myxococcales bacterium]|nr:hypothetical protein [Myxococcales bacterium]
MTRRLAVGVLFVMSGCVGDEVGTSEQAVDSYTDGAFTLTPDDTVVGYLSVIYGLGPSNLCATGEFRVALGVNMDVRARQWLNSELNGTAVATNGAIYLASTNQRLSFDKARITQIDFPRGKPGDLSESYVTLTVKPATLTKCTPVTASVMAAKLQTAATWAMRPALASNVLIDVAQSTPPPDAGYERMNITTIKPTPGRVSIGIGVGRGMYEWIKGSFDNKDTPRSGAFTSTAFEYGLNKPLLVSRFSGLESITFDGGITTVVMTSARIGLELPDGGLE